MISAVFKTPRDIRIGELPDPQPGVADVLVRVRAAGICGGDLHEFRAGHRVYPTSYPRPAQGHEFAGEVVTVGNEVEGLSSGDRVAVQPMVSCGVCVRCRSGRFSLCGRLEHLGVARSGGFAELCAVPAANAYLLPEAITWDEAALLDCVAVGVHAVHRASVSPGALVLVVGTGAIGFAVAQVARAAGAADVVILGRRAASLRVADELGLKAVAEEECAAYDVIYDTIGTTETLAWSVRAAARGGTVGVIGESFGRVAFDAVEAMERELTIAYCWSYDTWEGADEFETAIDLVAAGEVRLAPAITHRFPLTELVEAYETAADKQRSDAIKVLVTP